MTGAEKAEALQELYDPYAECKGCPLEKCRSSVPCFGYGNPNSPIMFIGTGPGVDEDDQCVPFVGVAGELLMNTLAIILKHPKLRDIEYLNEEELLDFFEEIRRHFYYTNLVVCRPHSDGEIREPTRPEIRACHPRLLEEIRIVDPALIVTLGSPAWKGVSGRNDTITGARGFFKKVPFSGQQVDPKGKPISVYRSVLPTFHPSHINLMDPDMEKLLSKQFFNDLVDAVEAIDVWEQLTLGDPNSQLPERAAKVKLT